MPSTFARITLSSLALSTLCLGPAGCSDDSGQEGSSEDELGETNDTESDAGMAEVGTSESGSESAGSMDTTDADSTDSTDSTTDTTDSTDTDTMDSADTDATDGTDTGTTDGTETDTSDTGVMGMCGDGIVDADEACDDGINDGSYGGCAPDCSALGPYCGDGAINGPEACDDANEASDDGCLSNCVQPMSCLEILEHDPAAPDGDYILWPNGPDFDMLTDCDMTTDGGGWTAIQLQHVCGEEPIPVTINSPEPATVFEFEVGPEDQCRYSTTDVGSELHTYVWDMSFPAGFDEFYLRDFSLKAKAGANGTSDIGPEFVQTSWTKANGSNHGDVSFGSGSQLGPVTSFAGEGAVIDCFDCEELFPALDTPFVMAETVTSFRIGWGESGSQSEGWVPWWEGRIYLR